MSSLEICGVVFCVGRHCEVEVVRPCRRRERRGECTTTAVLCVRREERLRTRQKRRVRARKLQRSFLSIAIDLRNEVFALIPNIGLLLLFCRGAFDPKVGEFIAHLLAALWGKGVIRREPWLRSGASDTYILVRYPKRRS